MGVISTNSHVCIHKLCLLCVCSQEFNFWKITTWAEGKIAGSRECYYRGVRWSGNSLRASSEYGVTLK